jgi:DNA primase
MKFRGRTIDPVALWGNYVEFPPNMRVDVNDEYLPLVRCPNPEHQTEKRHFQINVRQPLVHCFAGCGISGNYEDAIAMIEGVGNREARRRILRHSSLGKPEVRRKRERTVDVVSDLDLSDFSFVPQVATNYLDSRGIDGSSIALWQLGWNADEKRVTIPAFDLQRRLRFVIQRAVLPKQFPKYLYPDDSDKTRLLFGACQIDLGMVRSEGIVLVEGSLDVIRLHQHGFRNVVGILGSFVSEFQAREISSLRPKRIFTMFDKDASGVSATISTYNRLGRKIPIRVCRFPKGKDDPAEMEREEVSRAIENAMPWMKFASIDVVQAIQTRSKRSTRRISVSG